MIAWSQLVPFLALGFLGSLHCAGMCGGFALAVAGDARSSARGWALRQALYIAGKATAYAVLAALVAFGGTWLRARGVEGGAFLAVQTAVGVAAGILLVGMGLTHLGLQPAWLRTRWSRPYPLLASMRRAFGALRSLPGAAGVFGTGVANGLIPCGLSWGAVLLASQYEPAWAALGAFLFGLSTAPALVGVVAASRVAGHALQSRARVVLGIALVTFGVATAVRAWPHESGVRACCADGVQPASPGLTPPSERGPPNEADGMNVSGAALRGRPDL